VSLEEHKDFDMRPHLFVVALFQRIQELCGIRLNPNLSSKFVTVNIEQLKPHPENGKEDQNQLNQQDENQNQDNFEGELLRDVTVVLPFALEHYHLLEMYPIVKYMHRLYHRIIISK
jgi:hypothetical protein